MREAERHRYGLAATADCRQPGCDPNSPVPSHPRSVTLSYSEVHVIDPPSGLHDVLHAPGVSAGFSWSHPPKSVTFFYRNASQMVPLATEPLTGRVTTAVSDRHHTSSIRTASG